MSGWIYNNWFAFTSGITNILIISILSRLWFDYNLPPLCLSFIKWGASWQTLISTALIYILNKQELSSCFIFRFFLEVFSITYFSGLFRFKTILFVTSCLHYRFLFENRIYPNQALPNSQYVPHQWECLLI